MAIIKGKLGAQLCSRFFSDKSLETGMEAFFQKSTDIRKLLSVTVLVLQITERKAIK